MAGASITSSNAVYMMSVAGVYPVPVQLQGFSADDIFGTEALSSAEVSMGVDGRLSAGFVYVATVQGISLQADSPSNDFFDNWFSAQQAINELYPAMGVLLLPSIRKKWAMTRGFLTSYPPVPDGGKTLKPRRFGITWESVSPAPI